MKAKRDKKLDKEIEDQMDREFRKLNPKWQQARWSRWAFEFHVIEVQTR